MPHCNVCGFRDTAAYMKCFAPQTTVVSLVHYQGKCVMTVLHKQILLDQAKAGMILSDDLLDSQGNILLAKDVMLTDAILVALRKHQIEVISVVTGELTHEESNAKRQQYKERLARLFRKPTNDVEEATGILQQYVRYYRLGGDEE